MKIIAFLLISSFMLIGFGSVIREGNPFRPGAETAREGSISSENSAFQPVVRPAAVQGESESDAAMESETESGGEEARPDTRGPGISLFDFNGREPSWYVVNDSVMGGVSNSRVVVDSERQRLSFSGDVSLENNGGFASTRSQWASYDLSTFDGIALRVRGDGNTYRFRIRTEATGSSIAYTGLFTTEDGVWQEVYIPFSEMIPLYRGYVVNAAGPLNPESIRSFGLMLTDKQEGAFSLDVDWINAVAESKLEIRYAANMVNNEPVFDLIDMDA